MILKTFLVTSGLTSKQDLRSLVQIVKCPADLNKSETRQGARRGARRGLGCARSALRHLRRGECASVRQPSVCSEGRASLVKAPFDFDVQAGLNR